MDIEQIKTDKPQRLDDFWYTIYLKDHEANLEPVRDTAIADDFIEKNGKHITIIGSQHRNFLTHKLEMLDADEKNNLLDKIDSLINSIEWEFTPGEYFRVSKVDEIGKRESIIQLIDMPCMDDFYRGLGHILNEEIPAQFPHITLYTKGPKSKNGFYGINIPSQEEFKKLNPKKI